MSPPWVALWCFLSVQIAYAWRPDVDVESRDPLKQSALMPFNASLIDEQLQDANIGDFFKKLWESITKGFKGGDSSSGGSSSGSSHSSPKPSPSSSPSPPPSSGGATSGSGWCKGTKPDFKLNDGKCDSGEELKILSYNLFWWNLFKKRGGAGGSAGKNMKATGPFDLIGFQECEDVNRVLRDASMSDTMAPETGGHAVCLAYDKKKFKLLSKGKKEVAEDERAQHYGKRGVMWARLEETSGKKRTILFASHHGPLRVNSGGMCGGKATAWNLLHVLKDNSKEDDVIIIVGDFNADQNSETQKELVKFMNRVGSDWVDTIMTNCKGSWKTLPKGGSDHHAVMATIKI